MAVVKSVSEYRPRTYSLEHTYTVWDFQSVVDTFPPEKKIQSSVFGGGRDDPECRFFLNVYPNGSREKFAGYLGVFLHILGEEEDWDLNHNFRVREQRSRSLMRHCRAEFALTDLTGQSLFSRPASQSLMVKERKNGFEQAASNERDNWGFRRFLKKEDIFQHLLPDGRLLLKCSVKVIIPEVPQWSGERFRNLDGLIHRQWMGRIAELQSEKRFTDVRIAVVNHQDGKDTRTYFDAHKCILMADSEFFSALFRRCEDGQEPEVHDVSPDIFQIVLNFAYSGQLPETGELIVGEKSRVTLLSELLYAADMYCIDLLKRVVENRLEKTIKPDNLVEALTAEGPLSSSVVRGTILGLIREQSVEVFGSDKWKSLAGDDPAAALSVLTQAFISD